MPNGATNDLEDFEGSDDSGASIYPKQCSALRKNEHCVIKGKPCRIVEISTSKTGKHGHAKVHLVGIDIFTGKKYEDICPSTHSINVPYVKTKNYRLTNIDGEFLTLTGDAGETREDLKIPPEDLGANIKKLFDEDKEVQVQVVEAMGEQQVLNCKTMAN